ncbi:hypothetical protein CR155_05380 [Pollutimonas nitritireducens]|uniref:Uncharacterized protein n=1 Tax=Pollutimonas nitritireducens TaxID=2045209 RepID=A0A2N4UIQ6_9BURK|nr:hypothetical protein [Pollutimonas nitritireducens]PLC54891.1 hypothetical protein CR155_05380 [Pollutimonas nitritireducens]
MIIGGVSSKTLSRKEGEQLCNRPHGNRDEKLAWRDWQADGLLDALLKHGSRPGLEARPVAPLPDQPKKSE